MRGLMRAYGTPYACASASVIWSSVQSTQFDEDFAEQLLMVAPALLFERAVELLGLNDPPVEEQLAERFLLQRRNHSASHTPRRPQQRQNHEKVPDPFSECHPKRYRTPF